MSERHEFAEGKYTVINDNGKLTALRNGEPWERDLTGDNLVYWMLVESLRLSEQRDELLSACMQASFALRELLPSNKDAQFTVEMVSKAIAKAIDSRR